MKCDNFIKKYVALISAVVLSMGMFAGCGEAMDENGSNGETSAEKIELTILAAASLTDVCGEIEKRYEDANPNVDLVFSFGGSGALQTQIEEGVPADVFLPAATGQMEALDEQGLMESESIVPLLENKVVLIVPADEVSGENAKFREITSFEDVATDKVTMIGLGEPGSVPAGQYAEEIFINLGILEDVKVKANYGSDVRTVLSWVETGAVDCGVVYATDAYAAELVEIVSEAPEGSCKPVIYPVGVIKSSENAEAAAEFIEYLQSGEALGLFEGYGFAKAK